MYSSLPLLGCCEAPPANLPAPACEAPPANPFFLSCLLLPPTNLSGLLSARKDILVSSKLIGSCSWWWWSCPSARMAGRTMESRKKLWGTSLLVDALTHGNKY